MNKKLVVFTAYHNGKRITAKLFCELDEQGKPIVPDKVLADLARSLGVRDGGTWTPGIG